jgi:hypothetical protein
MQKGYEELALWTFLNFAFFTLHWAKPVSEERCP